MRAALAPADPHQHEEEEDSQDHQADEHPLWKDAQRNPRWARPAARAGALASLPPVRGVGSGGRGDPGKEASRQGTERPRLTGSSESEKWRPDPARVWRRGRKRP